MKQKRVFLICGIPGSGKSTWVRERIAKYGGHHISRDEIRSRKKKRLKRKVLQIFLAEKNF